MAVMADFHIPVVAPVPARVGASTGDVRYRAADCGLRQLNVRVCHHFDFRPPRQALHLPACCRSRRWPGLHLAVEFGGAFAYLSPFTVTGQRETPRAWA